MFCTALVIRVQNTVFLLVVSLPGAMLAYFSSRGPLAFRKPGTFAHKVVMSHTKSAAFVILSLKTLSVVLFPLFPRTVSGLGRIIILFLVVSFGSRS